MMAKTKIALVVALVTWRPKSRWQTGRTAARTTYSSSGGTTTSSSIVFAG